MMNFVLTNGTDLFCVTNPTANNGRCILVHSYRNISENLYIAENNIQFLLNKYDEIFQNTSYRGYSTISRFMKTKI